MNVMWISRCGLNLDSYVSYAYYSLPEGEPQKDQNITPRDIIQHDLSHGELENAIS